MQTINMKEAMEKNGLTADDVSAMKKINFRKMFSIACSTVNGKDTYHASFDFKWCGLEKLPDLSDVNLKGDFSCVGNKLKTLKGMPDYVDGQVAVFTNPLRSFARVARCGEMLIDRDQRGVLVKELETSVLRGLLSVHDGRIDIATLEVNRNGFITINGALLDKVMAALPKDFIETDHKDEQPKTDLSPPLFKFKLKPGK